MANRRVLFTALAPLLLLVGFMVCFRLLSDTSKTRDARFSAAAAELPSLPEYHPRPADDATRTRLIASIEGQLKAIRAKDWKGGQTFSAQPFRERVSPERFATLISQKYAGMTDWKKVEYKNARLSGEKSAVILATVTRKDLSQEAYRYTLTREGDEWRIDSCVIINSLISPYDIAPPLPYMPGGFGSPGRAPGEVGRQGPPGV